jgi:positive regulator of sigma E activity
MTQIATVMKVHAPGLCEVRVRRTASCGDRCDSCSALCETPDIDLLAFNNRDAAVGDRVLIEGSHTLLLAALVYLAPIVLFFIGWAIHPFAAGAGILLGIGGVLFVNRFLQERGGVKAKIVSILEKSDL